MNTLRYRAFGFIHLNRDLLLYFGFIFIFGLLNVFSEGRSDRSQIASDSGNLAIEVLWLFAFVNSTSLALLRGVKLRDFLYKMIWLLPLMIWIISSTWWSAYPGLTFRRAGREEIELITIVLIICTYSRPAELIRVLFFSFLTILCLDLASLLFPSISHSSTGDFRGIHGHKNSAGEFYFLALPVFILCIFGHGTFLHRLVALLASIVGAALLILSSSKTSIGMFLITSFCVLAACAPRWFRRYAVVIVMIYLLIIAIAVLVVLSNGIDGTLSLFTSDTTLTGRVPLWRYVLIRWQESPYLGQGYGALWQVGRPMDEFLRLAEVNWVMNEAHNGYVDILAQTGIVGLLLLGFFLVVAIWTILFAEERDRDAWSTWRYYSIYVALGVPLYNITETTLIKSGAGGWYVFVTVFAAAGLSKRYSIVKNVYPNDKSISGRLSCQRT